MAQKYQRLYDKVEEEEAELIYLSWKRLLQCNSKLSTVTQMASLMLFFAMVAVVELKFAIDETNESLIISLAIVTSLLVASTMVVKTISCSLIPYLESVVQVSHIHDVSRSPHEVMIRFINCTWLIATILLPSLFVINLIVMVWIKFGDFAVEAAYAASLILFPLLIVILAFGVVFCKQTIQANTACMQISKRKRLDSHLLKTRRSHSSASTLTYSGNFGEKSTLLPENSLSLYTSYGSTLPTNFITLCGFLD